MPMQSAESVITFMVSGSAPWQQDIASLAEMIARALGKLTVCLLMWIQAYYRRNSTCGPTGPLATAL